VTRRTRQGVSTKKRKKKKKKFAWVERRGKRGRKKGEWCDVNTSEKRKETEGGRSHEPDLRSEYIEAHSKGEKRRRDVTALDKKKKERGVRRAMAT